jgi:hypothetical protein
MTLGNLDPLPGLAALGTQLGADLLESILSPEGALGTSGASPELVHSRLAWLAAVVEHLSGSYDDVGVRAWFSRPRAALASRSPREVLGPGWAPGDDGPARVLALAAAGRDMGAT